MGKVGSYDTATGLTGSEEITLKQSAGATRRSTINALKVTGTGGTTSRTLADWMAGAAAAVVVGSSGQVGKTFDLVADFNPATSTGTDNSTQLLAAIAYALTNGMDCVVQGGKIGFSQTLDFGKYVPGAAGSVSTEDQWWEEDAISRPRTVTFECELYYTGSATAIATEGVILGHRLVINALRGPGVNVSPGTTLKGISIDNSGSRVIVGSVSDFDVGIDLSDAYSNFVHVDQVFACNQGVRFAGTESNANTLEFGDIGGVFTSDATLSARRDRSCDIGVYLASGATANRIVGGSIQYCMRNDDSVGLVCDGSNNTITAYFEGTYDDGLSIRCSGNNNVFRGVLKDSAATSIQSASITGFGNDLSSFTIARATAGLASSAPSLAGSSVYVGPGNITGGRYVEKAAPPFSALAANLFPQITSSWTWTGGSAATGSTDRPNGFPAFNVGSANSAHSVSLVAGDGTDAEWFTSPSVSLSGETLTQVLVSAWVKVTVGAPKIYVLLLDQSSVVITGYQTAPTIAMGWTKVSFLANIGAATSLKMRFAVRNPSGAGDATVLIYDPCTTFNIEGMSEVGGLNRMCRQLVMIGGTPASATAAGIAGTVVWDADYVYVCTAANTWKRVAIATWP